jgi:AcrR family transcriptional regulator
MGKLKTIDKILSAAEKEISSKGIDRAKIDCIAREAGVTKQLIYHYFNSKDQLYSAVLESATEKIRLFSDIEKYEESSPEEAIRLLVNTIIDGYVDNPAYAKYTLDNALHHGEYISRSSLIIPQLRAFVSETFAPVLERGGETAVFKKGLDADAVFWMIFNLSVSCFLNQELMSRTTAVDFSSPQGIEMWRASISKFILDALSP